MVLGGACSAQKKLKSKVIQITVIDKKNDLPIDSAQVRFITIVESRDVFEDVKYTDAFGNCSFSIEPNPVAQYQVGTNKKGFISYFDDTYSGLVRSSAFINEQTNDHLLLYLTSDTLNHINYWAKRTIRYDINTLIKLLKSNNYPVRSGFPSLIWEDIPGLLTIGNDSTIVNNYPISVISSGYTKDCYLGIIAVWFIESIRITQLKKIFDPLEKFPSQSPSFRYISNPEELQNNIKTMDIAYQAYKIWWEKIKNLDKENACKVNPLESVNLEWK